MISPINQNYSNINLENSIYIINKTSLYISKALYIIILIIRIKSMTLVAICGMAGSGKSTTREFFTQKGYEYIHLGVTEFVMKKFGYTNEDLERKAREDIRYKKGMGAFAAIAMPKIKELFKEGKDVVIDNMYSWSEYKLFKEEFRDDFYTIAMLASPKTRYERLASRKDDPNQRDYSDAQIVRNRDYHEIEKIEKGGPIAMADFYIINENGKEELIQDIENIYQKIHTHVAKRNS